MLSLFLDIRRRHSSASCFRLLDEKPINYIHRPALIGRLIKSVTPREPDRVTRDSSDPSRIFVRSVRSDFRELRQQPRTNVLSTRAFMRGSVIDLRFSYRFLLSHARSSGEFYRANLC